MPLQHPNVVRPDDALRELGNILKALVLQAPHELLRIKQSSLVDASHMDLVIVRNEMELVLTVVPHKQHK